jgi:hypothetical protein
MWCDRLPGGGGVRNSDDEPHLPSETLRKCDALELGRTQLGLQIAEATLNFQQHDLIEAGQNHVCCSAVGQRRDRNLEADAPGTVGRGANHLG